MEPITDQRKHRRHPVNIQGIYSSGANRGEECVVTDISLGGCRLTSTATLSADETIQLQIKPREAAPIYVRKASIRWMNGTSFGVQFEDVPEHESKALTRFLWSLPPLS